jgi:hypothetical protein
MVDLSGHTDSDVADSYYGPENAKLLADYLSGHNQYHFRLSIGFT